MLEQCLGDELDQGELKIKTLFMSKSIDFEGWAVLGKKSRGNKN